MASILSSEFFRLRRRLLVRLMLLIVIGMTVGVYIVQSTPDPTTEAGANIGDLRFENAPDTGLRVVYQLAVATSVVLAASTIATEYGWGTLRTVLARTGSRTAFFASKLASVLTFVVLVVVLGTVAAYATSYGVSVWKDLGTGAGDDASRFVLGPLRIFAAALPYVTLAFLVGLWTRTTAAGFGAVVVVFYLDVLLAPLFESGQPTSWVPDAFIWRNVSALLDLNSLDVVRGGPDAMTAVLILLAYTAAFIALAYWRFLSRDVLGSG